MKAKYFASVRERIGKADEIVSPPDEVGTVAELLGWLKNRGPEYAAAFADDAAIRTAVDQTHAKRDASIKGAREIAFFPPMTGG